MASEITDQRDLLVSRRSTVSDACSRKPCDASRYVLQKLSGQNIIANAPGAVLKERKQTTHGIKFAPLQLPCQRLLLSPRWQRVQVPRRPALLWARGGSPPRFGTM